MTDDAVNNQNIEALLGFAPAMVFVLIGGANGSIDEKTKDVFVKALEKLAKDNNKATADFALNAFKHTGDALTALETKKLEAKNVLETVAVFLNNSSDQPHAQHIRDCLNQLAETIAVTSSSFWTFGKPNKAVNEALETLKTILG